MESRAPDPALLKQRGRGKCVLSQPHCENCSMELTVTQERVCSFFLSECLAIHKSTFIQSMDCISAEALFWPKDYGEWAFGLDIIAWEP